MLKETNYYINSQGELIYFSLKSNMIITITGWRQYRFTEMIFPTYTKMRRP